MEDVVSFWENRRVFVSGASGLLGSWLVESLVTQGAEVIALVRDWAPGSMLLGNPGADRITLVRGELEDLPLLVRALNEYEVDSVFHLGAQTIVGTSSRSPISTFESNIRGTWNMLEAVRTCGLRIQRVVVASSDKAYGHQETLPYHEGCALQGRFPYDVSKSCADLIALSYFHTYGVPVAITRCGNLFGPGDLNFNRLIPGTIRSVLRGERPVIRSDGRYVRDYIFVRDAVRAYLSLAERLPTREFAGEAFNIGAGMPASVLEIVGHLLEVMGRTDLNPVILNEANHEIPCQYLDCAKARAMLGWRPLYGLREALDETAAWYAGRSHESNLLVAARGA
jgi:CDP-glucose 4,6-dehydratase